MTAGKSQSPSEADDQKFGGPWSVIKTEMVEKYLRFFNQALKKQSFERIYIDAFAGSGSFRYVSNTQTTLLFGEPYDTPNSHRGSAHRALDLQPPFDRVIFIEKKKANVEALNKLIQSSEHPHATVERGDANLVIQKLCHSQSWRHTRGVIFLDPFGMNVEWKTLEAIAATKALDVWFLFALAGTNRNLPRDISGLDEHKRAAVTRILGNDEWFSIFYKELHSNSIKLLEDKTPSAPILRREADIEDIERYVGERLRKIFPYVAPPKRLGPKNTQLFSLFFAVSNPSQQAITLAQKAAVHILAK